MSDSSGGSLFLRLLRWIQRILFFLSGLAPAYLLLLYFTRNRISGDVDFSIWLAAFVLWVITGVLGVILLNQLWACIDNSEDWKTWRRMQAVLLTVGSMVFAVSVFDFPDFFFVWYVTLLVGMITLVFRWRRRDLLGIDDF
ncbi:MAG: hypothetical protein PHC51_05475 [bacterium]|nr:hypothetical protein [bacterium]